MTDNYLLSENYYCQEGDDQHDRNNNNSSSLSSPSSRSLCRDDDDNESNHDDKSYPTRMRPNDNNHSRCNRIISNDKIHTIVRTQQHHHCRRRHRPDSISSTMLLPLLVVAIVLILQLSHNVIHVTQQQHNTGGFVVAFMCQYNQRNGVVHHSPSFDEKLRRSSSSSTVVMFRSSSLLLSSGQYTSDQTLQGQGDDEGEDGSEKNLYDHHDDTTALENDDDMTVVDYHDDPANTAWRLASLNLGGDAMTTYSTMPTATPTVSPTNTIPYHEYRQKQQPSDSNTISSSSSSTDEESSSSTSVLDSTDNEQHDKPQYVPYSRDTINSSNKNQHNEKSSSSSSSSNDPTHKDDATPTYVRYSPPVSSSKSQQTHPPRRQTSYSTTTTNTPPSSSTSIHDNINKEMGRNGKTTTANSGDSSSGNGGSPSSTGSSPAAATKDGKVSTDRAAQALNNLGAAGWIDSSVKSTVLSGPTSVNTRTGFRGPKPPSPKQSSKGVYQLTSDEEYYSFLQSHPDKLVVIKFYATYCQACRALESKFLKVKDDPQLDRLPIVWAEFAATRDTKELFRRLGVLTLPTIHFYDGSMLSLMEQQQVQYGQAVENIQPQTNLIENFPCPAAKVRLLKKKLARFLNARVDPDTLQLMPPEDMIVTSTEPPPPPPPHAATPVDSTTSADASISVDAIPVPPKIPQVPPGKTLDNIEATAASAFIAATTDNYSKATIDVTDTSSTVDATALPPTQDESDQDDTVSSDTSSSTVDVEDGSGPRSQARPTLSILEPLEADLPRVSRQIVMDNELVTDDHIDYLRDGMPFFRDLTDDEFEKLLRKARLLTFDVGDVICKQGMPGTTFYVLKRGVVEMLIRNRFEDPIRTPPSYLGVVAGELHRGDYFGERALSTGEPLAASFRVVEKVRCFAFKWEDIPESSILSQQRRATREMIEQLDKRYELPEDYRPYVDMYSSPDDQGKILDLLVRFRQIRQAAKCWNYLVNTSDMQFGDPNGTARRMMLFSRLSEAQQKEFRDVFDMVDVEKSGMVSLLEMRKFMATAGEQKSDEQLLEMIKSAGNSQLYHKCSEDAVITRNEFMGVMAEAEFYNLFTETFEELDKEQTGYVRAGDLAKILGGVQDLMGVGGTQTKLNIIDTEDSDMLVDYEQFSKMLLGASL